MSKPEISFKQKGKREKIIKETFWIKFTKPQFSLFEWIGINAMIFIIGRFGITGMVIALILSFVIIYINRKVLTEEMIEQYKGGEEIK